jgi:hypothetical protein
VELPSDDERHGGQRPLKIDSLIPDIYKLLASGEFTLDVTRLADMINRRLTETKSNASLRMSNFGTPCERKLWYTVNMGHAAEPLPPNARLLFLLGDIYEEVILSLAEQTTHTVEGRQDVLEVSGIKGHRDAVIDGVLVDVKSANGRSVEKFKRHEVKADDPFGYYDQLSLYHHASKGDVSVKDEAAFLAVDKERGHLYLDKYKIEDRDWDTEIADKKAMLADPVPPPRGFASQPFNKGGNEKLCVACAYCPFKKTCWPMVRSFAYSTGPVHLVKVVKEPDVPEIK